LSYQANWKLIRSCVCNIPVDGEEYKWIYGSSYIWTAAALNFFKLCISLQGSIMSFPVVQIYEPSYIHLHSSPSTGILALHQYRRGHRYFTTAKLCIQLRQSVISSYLSPQLKYMNFHMFTCKVQVSLSERAFNASHFTWSQESAFLANFRERHIATVTKVYIIILIWQILAQFKD